MEKKEKQIERKWKQIEWCSRWKEIEKKAVERKKINVRYQERVSEERKVGEGEGENEGRRKTMSEKQKEE